MTKLPWHKIDKNILASLMINITFEGVTFPTHNRNHILDLVITSSDSSLAPSLSSTHCSPSDHFPFFTKLSINPTSLPPPTTHSFCRLHSIDTDSFLTDLTSSRLITHPPKSHGSLLISYNTTLSFPVDKHAIIVCSLTNKLVIYLPFNEPHYWPLAHTHATQLVLRLCCGKSDRHRQTAG